MLTIRPMRILASLALLAIGFPLSAQASHCGACSYPPACVVTEQCSPVRYRVCQRVVTEEKPVVRYRPVYETCMKEEHYTVMRPVTETTFVEKRYTVARPVVEYHDEVVRETVMKPMLEQHVRQQVYTVAKPVMETYQVPVTTTHCLQSTSNVFSEFPTRSASPSITRRSTPFAP